MSWTASGIGITASEIADLETSPAELAGTPAEHCQIAKEHAAELALLVAADDEPINVTLGGHVAPEDADAGDRSSINIAISQA